ncbi:hypothetical protein GE21DRAFT_7699 [Neurospora crassa]|uniref:ZW10 C-terminal helical domain-containing protein n=1 Tax=Neurospora crassa (strain ATCC 24698 / 74-OR23-1A / CBS 708.71 / DSM 1257 / FGSC 987) TaxID=367110 RepID=V5ILM0_NEUCR|nr:hypothetical protein NCU01278 [Neurospora crassa OR74A]ESA42537.1 hypothetical protein NCU01278 [Neurospora crassa OR74A]KHE78945.1 hypothetical protein GE21DRAFT_7699 [Neurospora crassa]|eukprot:XP_011394498.1 hypothetical protein NCU01278 [Neurospora crassa OR74A]
MAVATPDSPAGQIAQALVDFSVKGAFPEESVSSLTVDSDALPAAIEALASAKAKLQAEIHTINEETADDVRTWKANAQLVQDDIILSKALANDILKQSEAPQASGKAIEEAETRAAFLARELDYNTQLRNALKGIKAVNQILDQVEQARDERRILDALHLLERSRKVLDAVPVNKSCRAIKLLDIRAFELKSDVYQVFDHVWNTLIHVDIESHRVSISGVKQDEPMSLSDAVVGLKTYNEVDQRATQLWHDIDKAIFAPRLDTKQERLPSIKINGNTLELEGTSDQAIEAVFQDLEKVFAFLVEKLPPELVETISTVLLPGLIPTMTRTWLDLAVPSSLEGMDRFQTTISTTKGFCTTLKGLGLSHLNELQEWTESAPRVWLSKRREAALDQIRTQLSQGLGASKQVERVEKQVVSKSEGQQLAANGAKVTEDDGGWDAWESDGEQQTGGQQISKPAATTSATELSADAIDDAADAWGWGEEDPEPDKVEEPQQKKQKQEGEEDDDPTEAWGWGDDAQNDDTAPEQTPTALLASSKPQTRELTFKETYSISSLPQPVLDLISALAEDGAALTQENYADSPVAAAAAGLFSLPTLALAMFRAVAPHYYAPDVGGNMFLYNDATYLSERLAEFAEEWVKRDNISTRAQTLLRLDNDIKSMQSFANRAYSNEMSIQKTVLRDLLGGEQNLVQQDDTESCVSAAVARVRSLAIAWESILSRSAWQQAVGSLVDAVANKIIGDVMDLPGIGQDEAYNIANHIASVTALDDLFLPSRFATAAEGRNFEEAANEIPTTAQYASSWLRLKYLSEVLQSNLKDVRYLWLESELSLYFSADEVVDLVNLSFEDNPRTREVLREIRARPNPLG